MRERRFIYLTIAVWVALSLAGCLRGLDYGSESDGSPITFDAGVELIRGDVSTKALNTNTSFTTGDKFRVFGRRSGEGKDTRIFYKGDDADPLNNYESVEVTRTSGPDKWSYTPPVYWYWVNESNYYDFIAVHPADASAERMKTTDGKDIPGYMAVKAPYNIKSDDYDLLMAASRRKGHEANRVAPVELTFHHMLSAVRFIVTNQSAGTNITLDSLIIGNVIQSAYAKMTIDAKDEAEYYWIDSQRTTDTLSFYEGSKKLYYTGYTPPEPPDAEPPYNVSYTTEFRLLIPADLSETVDGSLVPAVPNDDYNGKIPYLRIVIDGYTIPPILLKDIQRTRYGTDDPISVWEPGVRYTYNIDVRVDGGVIITVITTEWEELEAETPGLLIEDD